MTVGWASTYQPLEFCQRLAAEQPLPGQAVRTALSEFPHGTNNSYLDTLTQLSWAGRRSASALYPSASLLSVQCVQYYMREREQMWNELEQKQPIPRVICDEGQCSLGQTLREIWEVTQLWLKPAAALLPAIASSSVLHGFSDSYPHHMQGIYPRDTLDQT
jgi:hypothetical protein